MKTPISMIGATALVAVVSFSIPANAESRFFENSKIEKTEIRFLSKSKNGKSKSRISGNSKIKKTTFFERKYKEPGDVYRSGAGRTK